MNGNKEDFEINLKDLLLAVLRRWWIIAITTLIFAGTVFGLCYATYTPRYRATSMMYVNNNDISLGGSTSLSVSYADISASKTLVETYKVILFTRTAMQEVIDRSGLDYKYEQLLAMTTAEAVNETEILSVTVTCEKPEDAIILANTMADVLHDRIAQIVNGTSVKTVDRAVVARLVSPGFTKKVVVATIFELVAVAGIIIAEFLANDTIDSDEWIRKAYGEEIPLLAVIPDEDSLSKGYGKYGKYYKSRYYRYKDYTGKNTGKSL